MKKFKYLYQIQCVCDLMSLIFERLSNVFLLEDVNLPLIQHLLIDSL